MSKALTKLEQLRKAAIEAKSRVAELEGQRRSVARPVEEAKAALGTYYQDVELGEKEPNPTEEKRLAKALDEVSSRGHLTVSDRVLGNGRVVGINVRDERLEARIQAAHQRATEREKEIGMFILEHRDELEPEMIGRAEQAKADLFEAWQNLQVQIGAWARCRNEWATVAAKWGISETELPPNPFPTSEIESSLAPLHSGVPRDPRRFYPMPSSLVPGDWSDVPVSEKTEDGVAGGGRTLPVPIAGPFAVR